MNIVVDFTGFFVRGQYILKELAIAQISSNSIKIDYEILINTTAPPYTIEEVSNFVDFQDFIEKTKIVWNKKTNYTRDDLIEKFKSYKNHNIFVRDVTNAEILETEFGFTYPFMPLSRFGFDINREVMITNCANHKSPDSYCAKDNAKHMAQWLKENFNKSPTIENNFAATDLSSTQKLRVFCFTNEGTIIVNKLITLVFPSSVKSNQSTLDNYWKNYQEQFGVEYTYENLMASAMKNQLMKILLKNKIEFIFVIESNCKEFLLQLIGGPLFTIIVAESNGFLTGAYASDSLNLNDLMLDYNFESHEKEVLRMVIWVLDTEIYLTLRQEIKLIDSDN